MNQTADTTVAIIRHLITQIEKTTSPVSINPFKRIGNNRTYTIESDNYRYFAKQFFQNEGDKRDRFNAELAFGRYAEKAAPGFTPHIVIVDADNHIIIYEFINGSALQKDQIGEKEVKQAASFFCALNKKTSHEFTDTLLPASEACFSIGNHLTLINNRIEQIGLIKPLSDEDRDALVLVEKIKKAWNRLVEEIYSACKSEGLDLNDELIPECRVISTSDFGFHNALINKEGELTFLDFEYAGWDDPAKMLGDFFGQIQIPVPETFFDYFIELTFSNLPLSEYLIKRAKILYPAFRMKWACIAMNVFLPVHLDRRKFSNPDLDVGELKRTQLTKANDILKLFEARKNVIH